MRACLSILALAAVVLALPVARADDAVPPAPAAAPASSDQATAPAPAATDAAPAAAPAPAAPAAEPPPAAAPEPAATPAPAPAPVSVAGACTLGDGSYPTGTVFTTPNTCDESGYCTIQTCWRGAWYKRTLGCNQKAQTCPANAPS
jgi:hypothetical protein